MHKEPKVLKVKLAHKVILEHRGIKELLVYLVLMEHKEHKVLKVK